MIRTTAAAILVTVTLMLPAAAQDLDGAKDHPAISRYPEAVIDRYREEAFDEFRLITGPVKGKTAESSLELEGRLTDIR